MDSISEDIACMKKAKEIVMFWKSLETWFKAQGMNGVVIMTVESGEEVLGCVHSWRAPLPL